VLVVLVALVGCRAESGPHEERFDAPFLLAALRATACGHDGNCEGTSREIEAVLEVRDADGLAIPHALLRLTQPEGGRLTFQSDRAGRLRIRLGAPGDLDAADVWALLLPDDQDLLQEELDRVAVPLQGGSIRVEVVARGDDKD
jgi:hypothetical protein